MLGNRRAKVTWKGDLHVTGSNLGQGQHETGESIGKNCSDVPPARLAGNNTLDVFQKHREQELEERQQIYCWATWKEGLPMTIAAGSKDDLPPNMRFHEQKRLHYEWTVITGLMEMDLKYVYTLPRPGNAWKDFDQIFWRQKIALLVKKVHQRWQDDELFGYQFLNGTNPMLLRRSTSLPPG
ncbi:hypothetical protein QTO34_009546 [Cnephaeus nilssonii]|uniref:Lipoxygenase domain-containing protein n=1 Tax=Cnephaeus nilssonii TaxID=3371016 RepID=A0AA40LH33_CNENI|nr:hypothetical protein QTO34_009546 [Eptesicus nilssonii]